MGAAVGAANLVATQRVQWRAQVTERFSKAIEQLGQREDAKLDVRIDAAYALEQIARQSCTGRSWRCCPPTCASTRRWFPT